MFQRRAGVGDVALQHTQPGAGIAGSGVGIVTGVVHQRLQFFQLLAQNLQRILLVFQNAVGFHLPDNAARFLAGVDGAVVGAGGDIAGLAAHNAAHVVAHMLVAHGTQILAVFDHTGAAACHTADIGDVGDILGADQVLERQRGNIDLILLDLGVYAGFVDTVGDHTVVIARDAAHKVGAVHTAGGGAAVHRAAGKVLPHDAAHHGHTAGHTHKAAIFHRAGIAARHAADGAAAALGHDTPLQRQVLHHGVRLQIAEKSHHRAVLHKVQVADGMPLPVKGAVKNRDPGKPLPHQIQIGIQQDGAVGAVGVKAAIPGKLQKLVHRCDMHGRFFLRQRLCVLGKSRQCQADQQDHRGKSRRQAAHPRVFHCSPPPSVVSLVSAASASATLPSVRYISGCVTFTSVPVEMAALNCPCSTPLMSASTTPLM